MATDASPPIPSKERPPPLVGRGREQTLLRDRLTAALAGRGGLVLIGGEAGIGKTALAEALLHDAADQGALVAVGRCYDLAETPPYGPWAEAFARLPGVRESARLPAPLGDGAAVGSQAALFARVREALISLTVRQPLVLLLDDLHWADPASLDLLRAVARELTTAPLLLLATYRADELTERHPLAALLPALVREAGAARLDLRRLGDGDLRALLAARYPLAAADEARLVAYLRARAEGNPFYTGEYLRAIQEEGLLRGEGEGWALGDLTRARVPALLRQVVAARVARLGEDARHLLSVAAVVGQEVPFELWAAVSEAGEDRLLAAAERAVEARLLEETPDGAGLRFAHALVREALYEAVLPPRRRAWHRRAGEVLADGPHPDPDSVAYHLRLAGDPRAAEWLIRAGVRARRAAAWVTAAERFATAAALLEADGARTRERGWLLFYCGLLLRFADNAQAIHSLDEAEHAALAADDPVLAACARFQRGTSRCMAGEIHRGLAEIEQGVAALDELPGEYHLRSNDALALATIQALLPEAERAAPPPPPRAGSVPPSTPQRGVLINWLGQAGRYREAHALGEAFIATMLASLGEDHARLYPCLSGHVGLGNAYAALGRPDDARREYALARRGFGAIDDAFMVQYTLWAELLMAVLPYEADQVAERARLAAEAARAWERASGTSTNATVPSQSDLLLALPEGRWAEAYRLARAGLGASTIVLAQGAAVALGALAWYRGEPDLAWAQVRQLHPAGPETAPGDCYFPHGISAQALAVELELDAGDVVAAGRWIAAHERWLDWSGAVRWRADLELLRARHARVAGEPERARLHADAALRHATHPRQPLALLEAHRLLGELAAEAGRHAEAAAHLDEALALAEACAAPYERALTLLALAELRAAIGKPAESRSLLDEARALLTLLAARPTLARADALDARLAAPAPAPPAALPFGLTAREAEVLRLLAEGLPDARIAERLFISVPTVKAHLRSIYGKLGVPSRSAATRVALEHHLA